MVRVRRGLEAEKGMVWGGKTCNSAGGERLGVLATGRGAGGGVRTVAEDVLNH